MLLVYGNTTCMQQTKEPKTRIYIPALKKPLLQNFNDPTCKQETMKL